MRDSARWRIGTGSADAAIGRLRELHRLLVEDPLAPTAVRDPRQGDRRPPRRRARGAGSRGGARGPARWPTSGAAPAFPGLPLAIALPGAGVALVESAARKTRVPGAGGGRLRGDECPRWSTPEPRHGRRESPHSTSSRRGRWRRSRWWSSTRHRCSWSAARSSRGGAGATRPARPAAARAAAELGLEPAEVVPVKPYPAAESRHLYLMSKVTETPRGFPRRPGMALKRPLGCALIGPGTRGSDRGRR